ncbi:dynein light chain type 1 domain-containing protein [Ditylenchus destructor]|uniref:Dynein light chain type 1 domain-containing protein n=1 Tax=Ditylenchus destructor TaxID=166010 RepID=A0AAD4MSV9_9BILA|nr:dynein light chain type 1 domain-containing protein [Ditylenchus destructor]
MDTDSAISEWAVVSTWNMNSTEGQHDVDADALKHMDLNKENEHPGKHSHIVKNLNLSFNDLSMKHKNEVDAEMSALDNDEKFACIEKANTCLEKNDFISAKMFALEALVHDNKFFDGWYNCAQASFALAKNASDDSTAMEYINDAQKKLDKCKALNPGEAKVWYLQGNLALLQNDYRKAVESFTESLDIEPNPDVFLSRCKLYFAQKNYETTISDADAVLGYRKDDFEALQLKGETLAKLKLDLNEESASLIKERLMEQYIYLRKFDKALELCNKLEEEKASSTAFYAMKMIALLEQKKYKEVSSILENFAKLDAQSIKGSYSSVSTMTIASGNEASDSNKACLFKKYTVDDVSITDSEMDTEMENYAVDRIVEAINTSLKKQVKIDTTASMSDVAEIIQKKMAEKYRPDWHCIMASNLGFSVSPREKRYIQIRVADMDVLVFKG